MSNWTTAQHWDNHWQICPQDGNPAINKKMLPKKPEMLPEKQKNVAQPGHTEGWSHRIGLQEKSCQYRRRLGPAAHFCPLADTEAAKWFFSFSCISVVSHGVTFKLIEVRRSVAVSSNQADAANLILVGWVRIKLLSTLSYSNFSSSFFYLPPYAAA